MDPIFQFFATISWGNIFVALLRIALVLVIARIVVVIAKRVLYRAEAIWTRKWRALGEVPSESVKRAETLARLLRQAVIIVVWVIAALVILREMGIDIGPVLASAGIVGLAVGFGAQNLIRDVISGFFLILENQVCVGDVAVVNGTAGVVEEINFRTIVLRDLAGVKHIFPNGAVSTLSNMTQDWSAYVFEIGVAYKEDVDRVMDIMRDVGVALRAEPAFGPSMLEDVEIFGVENFSDSAVMIKGRLKTRPSKQWEVGREYRRRLKYAFDRAGVEIPFPHRSISFGEKSKPFLDEVLKAASTKEG